MASVKLIKFLGEAPKISSELLPDGAAQTAFNVKLYSGDLLPYRTPVIVDSTERTGTIKTLHALKNPSTNVNVWLSWLTEVDIATASDSGDDEQRFYYTGDGVPKVSNYELATNGSEPYPVTNGYYELGLPLPDTEPVNTATSFTVVSNCEGDTTSSTSFFHLHNSFAKSSLTFISAISRLRSWISVLREIIPSLSLSNSAITSLEYSFQPF